MKELRVEYGRFGVLVPPLEADWSILVFVMERVLFFLLSLDKITEKPGTMSQ